MALREFSDHAGRAWTVWEMRPEQMHARTRGSAALGAFAEGWLCFESDAGEKRRLSPIPDGWEALSNTALAELCASASPARTTPERGSARIPAETDRNG